MLCFDEPPWSPLIVRVVLIPAWTPPPPPTPRLRFFEKRVDEFVRCRVRVTPYYYIRGCVACRVLRGRKRSSLGALGAKVRGSKALISYYLLTMRYPGVTSRRMFETLSNLAVTNDYISDHLVLVLYAKMRSKTTCSEPTRTFISSISRQHPGGERRKSKLNLKHTNQEKCVYESGRCEH